MNYDWHRVPYEAEMIESLRGHPKQTCESPLFPLLTHVIFGGRFHLSINEVNLVTSKDLFPEIMLRTKNGIRLNFIQPIYT